MGEIVKELQVKCTQFGVCKSISGDMEIYLRKNAKYNCYIYDDNTIYLETKDFKLQIPHTVYEKYFKIIDM